MAYQHGITVLISIHALREEGDLYCVCMALSI